MTTKVLAEVSSVLNVVLAILLYHARVESRGAGMADLRAGDRVSALIGADLMRQPRSVEYPSAMETVLYAFSPDCSWCSKNQGSVERLARSLQGKFRFVGVSLERRGLFDWTVLQQPEYEVVTDLPYQAFLTYRFASTPTTIVVSREGSVKRIWKGAYRGAVLKEIETYFSVSLPEARVY
jgi:hypothetical protein